MRRGEETQRLRDTGKGAISLGGRQRWGLERGFWEPRSTRDYWEPQELEEGKGDSSLQV